jgi:hypothetical protein
VTGEYTTADGTTSTAHLSRTLSSGDLTLRTSRPSSVVNVNNDKETGFYGSPGLGTTRNYHVIRKEKEQNSQQWSTPLLAKNNRLLQLQSEQKILRNFPFPSPSPINSGDRSYQNNSISIRQPMHTFNQQSGHRERYEDRNENNSSRRGEDKNSISPSENHHQQEDRDDEDYYFVDGDDSEEEQDTRNSEMSTALALVEEMWHEELIGTHHLYINTHKYND